MTRPRYPRSLRTIVSLTLWAMIVLGYVGNPYLRRRYPLDMPGRSMFYLCRRLEMCCLKKDSSTVHLAGRCLLPLVYNMMNGLSPRMVPKCSREGSNRQDNSIA